MMHDLLLLLGAAVGALTPHAIRLRIRERRRRKAALADHDRLMASLRPRSGDARRL